MIRIDGVDTWTAFGVRVEEDRGNEVLSFPSIKPPRVVDWAEIDGLDVDLEEVHVSAREFSVGFVVVRKSDDKGFVQFLASKAYHDIEFLSMKFTVKARYVSVSRLEYLYEDMKRMTVVFSIDDNSIQNATPRSSISSLPYRGLSIDGVDIRQYGMFVRDLGNLYQGFPMKSPFIYQSAFSDGRVVLSDPMKRGGRDVSVPFGMIGATLDELWNNYHALLYALTRNGSRLLRSTHRIEVWECYYKSMHVSKYHHDLHAIEFTLTLCMMNFKGGGTSGGTGGTGGETPQPGDILAFFLASEDDCFLITEDGKKIIF